MGIKIKNLQTGEFEKFNIPALKGEKGEPGEIEPSEKVDYIGKQHSKLRDTMNANVDYIIKTAIGEFNYLDYEGQHITATNSIEGHAKSAILKGNTEVIIGKNLFNGKLEDGCYSQFTGVKEEEADSLRSVDFIKVEPSSTICCSNNGIARTTHIFEYDENKKFLKFNDAITKVTLLPYKLTVLDSLLCVT